MTHVATLIPGDGVGPEVVESGRRAIEATGVGMSWERADMGAGAFARTGSPLPDGTLESIRRTGVALKGPIETPITSGSRSVNLTLRRELDLFANVRPCRHHPDVPSLYGDLDLVVIRENTEDSYTGVELEMGTPAMAELARFVEGTTHRRLREDAGVSVKAISDRASERIARFAFGYATTFGRTKVTAGHKANIMKFSDGVFLEAARRVASDYPEIPFEDRIIDALCMQLVQMPEAFDVLVLPNLYGDMVAELGAGLIGGTGLAPGGHYGGADGRERAVFDATHGTAPALAGTDAANPVGLILCGAMLLRFLGEEQAADRLEEAVAATIAAGEATADVAAPGARVLGTRAFTEAVIGRL